MSRIAILIQNPVNTLVAGNLPEPTSILIQKQTDGQFIMHGESKEIKDLLMELQKQILLRKANSRNLDSGTVEYYHTCSQALQHAIDSANHIESNFSPKP